MVEILKETCKKRHLCVVVTATHCNTLQHAATHWTCSHTLQYTASRCITICFCVTHFSCFAGVVKPRNECEHTFFVADRCFLWIRIFFPLFFNLAGEVKRRQMIFCIMLQVCYGLAVRSLIYAHEPLQSHSQALTLTIMSPYNHSHVPFNFCQAQCTLAFVKGALLRDVTYIFMSP